MRATVAVVTAALLTLSACGGGGDESEAKDNLAESFAKEEGGALTGADLTEDEAGCLSDGLVDEVGVEKLQEYGILEDDLAVVEDADDVKFEAGDAAAFAGVVTDCVDVSQLITDQMAEQDLTAEQEECVSEALDEDAVRDLLSATFQGQEPEMDGAIGDAMACVMEGQGMVLPEDAKE